MKVISVNRLNLMPLAKFNKKYENSADSGVETQEITNSGMANLAYLGKNISFGLNGDAGFLSSQSERLRCAYSKRPLISQNKFRVICADLADRTNAQSAINRLKQYEQYFGDVEAAIFYTFEDYKNKGKKDFQDILQEILPESLTRLQDKQLDILNEVNDTIDSMSEPLKTQISEIRDEGINIAESGYFGRRTFLNRIVNLIDEKFKPFIQNGSSFAICNKLYDEAQEIMSIYINALSKLVKMDEKFNSDNITEVLKDEYRKLYNCEPFGSICINFWRDKELDEIKIETIEEIRKHGSHSKMFLEQSAEIINLLTGPFTDKNVPETSYDEIYDKVKSMIISDVSVFSKLDVIASQYPDDANKLKEVYKKWYRLPRSTNDYDAFVVKYSRCSHKKIVTDLIRNSVGMVQKIKAAEMGGEEKLSNYFLVSSEFNNEAVSMPLTDIMELYPELNIPGNIQDYMDNVSNLMRQEKSPFRYRTSYLSDIQSTIAEETNGEFRPEINQTSNKEQKVRKKNSGKRNTRFSVNK